MQNWKKIYTSYLLALSLTVSCGDNNKANVHISEQEQTFVEVDTLVLRQQIFHKQLLCNGNLAAIQKADLLCPKQGDILQHVYVKNGQYVKQGTLLAIVDTQKATTELEKAKHDLERAKIELQDKLIGLGYDGDFNKVPTDILHRAEITSGYYSAKYQMETMQKSLDDCGMYAPFNGRIANMEARAHQSGTKFCTLIDDSFFDVEFKILEAELSYVKEGQTVKVSPFITKNETYEGVITEINPTIDEKGLIKMKARIKKTSDTLMDGMNVRVIVENTIPDMLVVPKEAVVERDGYHVIFLYDLQNNRSVWTYIDIMYSNLTSFAITGCCQKETEIHEGDIVITSGNLNLADETEVRISHE